MDTRPLLGRQRSCSKVFRDKTRGGLLVPSCTNPALPTLCWFIPARCKTANRNPLFNQNRGLPMDARICRVSKDAN
jgi:hypothetical protein